MEKLKQSKDQVLSNDNAEKTFLSNYCDINLGLGKWKTKPK